MLGMYAIAAIALIAAGVIVGGLIFYAIGIYREEKAHSLNEADPGRISGGLRGLTRAYAHPQLPELNRRHRAGLALVGPARIAKTR